MNAHQFFRSVYADNRLRGRESQRSLATDVVHYIKNRALQPIDFLLSSRHQRGELPIVFIVGSPRTGTTLLYQLMAEHLRLGFVNNKMSRYWAAPLVGAVLHGTQDFQSQSYHSNLGNTSGPNAPHEFSWFWHYHADFRECDQLNEDQLRRAKSSRIRTSLRGLASHFGSPLIVKNVNHVTFQVAWLARLLPEAKFVWTKRNRIQTAESILRSRVGRYGNEQTWWATRPRGYRAWHSLCPQAQIVNQINAIEVHLQQAFSSLPQTHKRVVNYEDLTNQPAKVLRALAGFAQTAPRNEVALKTLRLEYRQQPMPFDSDWSSYFSESKNG